MVNRVTGLSSGIDTESLVKQMMALSQAKYDNIMKKKTETEWKKQLYDDIYTQLKSFDSKLFDSTLSSFNAPKTAASTNESIAAVTASNAATNGSYTLQVQNLASSANLSGKLSNTSLEDLGLEEGMKLTVTGSDGSKEITISKNMTVNDLVSEINKSSLGIKATYDTNSGYLFFKSSSTGKDAQVDLSLTDDTGAAVTGTDFLNALGANGASTISKSGENAKIVLDGAVIEQSSNNFTIAGMTFNLKSTSNETVTVDVKSDNTKLLENVKSLVKTYNDLLELINGRTSEKYYRDYSPLTSEQKNEMSEKEIELWEEKAKSGLLRNDSVLTGLASKMRTDMYSAYDVDGKFKTMSSIGISTTNYGDKGKLTINEEKLLAALEEDPDAVSKLFKGGLVDTLREDIKSAMTQMERKSGAGQSIDTQSSWAKEIRKYDDQLDALSARMLREENKYYTQFAAMEKAMSNMNSSSSYLTSMIGS